MSILSEPVETLVWAEGDDEATAKQYMGLTIQDAALRFATSHFGKNFGGPSTLQVIAKRDQVEWALTVRRTVSYTIDGLRGGS